jgi:hypothetical protein
MPEEILPLDEVERIAKQFAKDRWNTDENQTGVESVKCIKVGEIYVYEVRGSVSQSHLASDSNP